MAVIVTACSKILELLESKLHLDLPTLVMEHSLDSVHLVLMASIQINSERNLASHSTQVCKPYRINSRMHNCNRMHFGNHLLVTPGPLPLPCSVRVLLPGGRGCVAKEDAKLLYKITTVPNHKSEITQSL